MSGDCASKNASKKNRFPAYLIAVISLCVVGIAVWKFFPTAEMPEEETAPKVEKKKVVKPTKVKPIKVEPEKPKEEVVMKRDRKGNLRPWKRP